MRFHYSSHSILLFCSQVAMAEITLDINWRFLLFQINPWSRTNFPPPAGLLKLVRQSSEWPNNRKWKFIDNIKVAGDNKARKKHKFLLKMIVFLLIFLLFFPFGSGALNIEWLRQWNSRIPVIINFLESLSKPLRFSFVICKKRNSFYRSLLSVHFIDFLPSPFEMKTF
jgi:hypothetical protein